MTASSRPSTLRPSSLSLCLLSARLVRCGVTGVTGVKGMYGLYGVTSPVRGPPCRSLRLSKYVVCKPGERKGVIGCNSRKGRLPIVPLEMLDAGFTIGAGNAVLIGVDLFTRGLAGSDSLFIPCTDTIDP